MGGATTTDVAGSAPQVLLVPLGATEQHGPHLPLSTDTTLAARWAEGVAARLGSAATVAPALPYGSSGEHQSFPGTVSIGADAVQLVLLEITRSAATWVDQVVFLSGHAGNLDPVTAAVEQLRREGHQVSHFFPRWDVSLSPPIDAHAGRTETSLMLHLSPDDVRQPLPPPGNRRPLAEIIDELRHGGVAAVSASGVLGDPTRATAEEGKRLLDQLIDRTVVALSAIDVKWPSP